MPAVTSVHLQSVNIDASTQQGLRRIHDALVDAGQEQREQAIKAFAQLANAAVQALVLDQLIATACGKSERQTLAVAVLRALGRIVIEVVRRRLFCTSDCTSRRALVKLLGKLASPGDLLVGFVLRELTLRSGEHRSVRLAAEQLLARLLPIEEVENEETVIMP